ISLSPLGRKRRNEMRISIKVLGLATAVMGSAALFVFCQTNNGLTVPNLFRFKNGVGEVATFSNGTINLENPFFQSLGTNGRTCASCHLPDQGWSIAANSVQARFTSTGGLDPIFRTNDGSVCDHDI